MYDPGFDGCAFGGGGVVGGACTAGRVTGRVGVELAALAGSGGAAGALDAVRAARAVEVVSNIASKARVVAKLRTVETGVADATRVERAVDGSGGLFRVGEPVGGSSLEASHEAVAAAAQRGGVGLEGVDVNIIKDPALSGSGFYGYTHPGGGAIDLYPDAFESEETLVRTLGHERTHVMQQQLYGPATHSIRLSDYERAAYGSEQSFVDYLLGGWGG